MIGPRTGPRPRLLHLPLDRPVAWTRLVRLSNSLPAALLVLLAPHLLDVIPVPAATWRAAVAMWCITAFGYVTNDLADVAEDRINKPDRPLPSGRLSIHSVQAAALGLATAGLAFAVSVSLLGLLVATGVLLLLVIYSHRLKGTSGLGNALIGILAGSALFAGGVSAVGLDLAKLRVLLPPALTLTAFITAREVLKTLEDVPGDRAAGKATMAVRHGITVAHRAFAVMALLTVLAGLLPVILYGYSLRYLVLVAAGVHVPLLFAAVYLARSPSPHRVRHWLAVLKASYLAGLAALFLS